jgi:hypothetical protein
LFDAFFDFTTGPDMLMRVDEMGRLVRVERASVDKFVEQTRGK